MASCRYLPETSIHEQNNTKHTYPLLAETCRDAVTAFWLPFISILFLYIATLSHSPTEWLHINPLQLIDCGPHRNNRLVYNRLGGLGQTPDTVYRSTLHFDLVRVVIHQYFLKLNWFHPSGVQVTQFWVVKTNKYTEIHFFAVVTREDASLIPYWYHIVVGRAAESLNRRASSP